VNGPRRFRAGARGYAPEMHHGVWELVFLMVILKIPIAYLIGVIWYAIKAKPLPGAGAGVTVQVGPEPTDGGRRHSRRFGGPRPHGGPTRSYPRAPRTAGARAEADRR
jgi:hypothetical protein